MRGNNRSATDRYRCVDGPGTIPPGQGVSFCGKSVAFPVSPPEEYNGGRKEQSERGGENVGGGIGKLGAAALLLGLALLCGCATPRQGAKPEQPEQPLSVHLPVMETTDKEFRAQPPAVQPQLALPPPHPDEVEEGKARSLNMLEIRHDGGKASRPSGGAPPEADEKP